MVYVSLLLLCPLAFGDAILCTSASCNIRSSAGQDIATYALKVGYCCCCCPLQEAQLQEQRQQLTATLQEQEQQLGEMQQQLQDTAAATAEQKASTEQKQQELDSLTGTLQATQQVNKQHSTARCWRCSCLHVVCAIPTAAVSAQPWLLV
jgi:Skp family chaperone for outer membrane proteins